MWGLGFTYIIGTKFPHMDNKILCGEQPASIIQNNVGLKIELFCGEWVYINIEVERG